MSAAPLRTVHLLAHTHWDREWYQPVARFRQALVALVDDLLHGGATPDRPFLLDGQAVVLEDVLAVRPDWAPALGAALRSGALEAGPWYVLADALIPSGEALVRNLLVGRRVLARFGAVPPPVCYAPDSFGHPAALPALAVGFGLAVGILWRGYGSARWPAGDAARWRAPDGSALLLWHLPPDGYEFGSALPADPDAAHARWQRVLAVLGARAATRVSALMVGADHHARSPHLEAAVRALTTAAAEDGVTLRRTGLAAWAVHFAAVAPEQPLPEVRGELRDSYGYTWTLQGTLATRAWQKRAVARLDRAVRWDVEPWLAMQRLAAPSASREPLGDLLHHLWRTVLRTLPHDTLCGCAIDDVARALDQRVAAARAEARGLRARALDGLLGRDPVAARNVPRDAWQPRLVVRNRSVRRRYGLVEVTWTHTIADVPVGPGSGASPRGDGGAGVPLPGSEGLIGQPLVTRHRYERRESPQHYPDNDLVAETRGLVWWPQADALDGLAMATVPLAPLAPPTASAAGGSGPATPSREARPSLPAGVEPVRARRRNGAIVLENERLRLTLTAKGLTLRDLSTGRTLRDLLHLTWQADHGDSYTPAPRGPLRMVPPVRARLLAGGPLRAAVRITYALRVPARSAPDERHGGVVTPPANPTVRGRGSVPLRVRLTCTLDADAGHVGLALDVRAPAGDHRLRLSVATGTRAPTVVADAAVWPVVRPPLALSPAEAAIETYVPGAPLHRWVAAHDARGGALVISDGLAEYEALADGRLAVTLQRATGELSRATLPERPGHAGWPARTPAAQGAARSRARLAIAPCGTFAAGWACALAEDVLRPLVGTTWRDAPALAPRRVPGFTLEGPREVVALAVKPAEDGNGLIARCVNLSSAPQVAVWRAPWPDVEARLVRLDEMPVETPDPTREAPTLTRQVEHDTTCCALALPPFAIASLRLRRAADPKARRR